LFGLTGSYSAVSIGSIVLSLLVGVLNLPIDERPLGRLSADAEAAA
jgi:hypothetical protein